MTEVYRKFVIAGLVAYLDDLAQVEDKYLAEEFPVHETLFAVNLHAQQLVDVSYRQLGLNPYGVRDQLDRLFLEAVKQWREKSAAVTSPAVIYLASSDAADFDPAEAVAFSDSEMARSYAVTRFGEYGFVEHMTIESNVEDRLTKDKARLVSRLRNYCSNEDLALLNL